MVVASPTIDPQVRRSADHFADLKTSIDHAAHLLPTQGPIEVFVHHNTLHAFEDHAFEDAVQLGLETFGGEPYWPESRYRSELVAGRIRTADLEAVLFEDLGDRADSLIAAFGPLYQLRLAMLRFPLRSGTVEEIHWVIAETDGLTRFQKEVSGDMRGQMITSTRKRVARWLEQSSGSAGAERVHQWVVDFCHSFGRKINKRSTGTWTDADWEAFTLHLLWQIINDGVQRLDSQPGVFERTARHRDLLLQASGVDTDEIVNEYLIRFCSLYIDEGLADWGLKDRDRGFFRCFLDFHGQLPAPTRWLRSLGREARRLSDAGVDPLESIDESLTMLGVPTEERDSYLKRTLLALPGWAGMLQQMEHCRDGIHRTAAPGSLVGYLAVRLLLERLAAQQTARDALDIHGELDELRSELHGLLSPDMDDLEAHRAFQLFQLAQIRGWHPIDLLYLSRAQWQTLIESIESFSPLERRRIFHLAYERHYRNATLDALIAHSQRIPLDRFHDQRPSFQISCCIDDREESFRRHLEEVDGQCQTFGAAGFFAVAMNYQGVADVGFKPLCPVIIEPHHFVIEDVGYTFQGEHKRKADARKAIGHLRRQAHWRSRTFLGGIVTALLGTVVTAPLVARVLFPRVTAQLRRHWGSYIQPPPITQLRLERYQPEPGPETGRIGYTVAEMTDIVERLLRDMGLLTNFSRLVVIMGHGSSSLNNPHESAYNCGACAGKRGGPNARAFAQMANDWRVRTQLAERNIVIPDDTAFVGAYHNTCSDGVEWFDLDRLPSSHHAVFEQTKRSIDEARKRNAHERTRRFETAELTLTAEEALRHVESRAEDLSQVRPEYNHATNALCFVGRRAWSRSLFVDRRVFLTSYDPAVDDEHHSVLLRILGAAIPVCAGINLEYYFSCVDPVVYGAGSKLPHNVASLLGVMEGTSSDLRTGLYQQMVEIHEPMRIIFVVETTPEAMLSIMDRHAGIGCLCRGNWVQLAVFDPATSRMQLFKNGRFHDYQPEPGELPSVNSSLEWYRGRRESLGFATISDTSDACEESRS